MSQINNQRIAIKTIHQVERIQKFAEYFGTRFCWLADEWYLILVKIYRVIKLTKTCLRIKRRGSIRSFLKKLEKKTKNLPQKVIQQKKLAGLLVN